MVQGSQFNGANMTVEGTVAVNDFSTFNVNFGGAGSTFDFVSCTLGESTGTGFP
jgi:hypothetical protein